MIIRVIILSMLFLAIIERLIYFCKKRIRETKPFNILHIVLIVFDIVGILVISYFITDTNTGLLHTVTTFTLGYSIVMLSICKNNTIGINIVLILIIPLEAIEITNMIQHILIDSNILLFFIILVVHIHNMSINEDKKRKGRKISLVIGIFIAILINVFYLDITEIEKTYKQEIIAEEFLTEELNLFVSSIHTERKLRGEDTEIRAYRALTDSYIVMIYRNNSIVSYSIEE